MYAMKKNLPRKLTALLLVLCMAVSLCPVFTGAASAVGESAMDQLMNWGVVAGYPDGRTHPERNLTRAEFTAMVNRAYGYKNPCPTPFRDVAANAWYYDDIGIAYNAHYFNGVSPRMAAPDSTLTREMAMVLLARNMRLDPVGGEVTEFADGRSFSEWSRGYARAAAQTGLIGGYGDGTYKPQNDISRGEMAIMLQRALGTLINKPGTHTLSDTYGNVTISSTGTTLKDSTIAGNLYITGGLDLGDVTLDNVRVLGDIIVAGGGESHSGEDSVVLRNVVANSLLIDSIADQFVTVRAEGNTEIADTALRSDAFVQDRTRPGQGLLNISLESIDPGASFTLSGNLETVVNKAPGSTLNIAMGTVDTLTIDEAAAGSALNLDIHSTAMTLNLDTATAIAGNGDIDNLYVNAAGSVIEMLPDKITIRPGLTADIAGETMNAAQAQESSADPRLLAGYPKARNVAPTGATAVFSTNKGGTVYWAVSTTTDGSVGEDELITPTEGNTAAVLSGSTPIAASNTETTAALASLTPDGNYYLSAVMVDARDRHSPVKVASFTTPDNTAPAFNAGYPAISQNDYTVGANGNNYRIQISYMPNKSCMLYYALYNSGSAAPTAQQFRVGALGRPLQSGVVDTTKNVLDFLPFSGLKESTTYDLYLCLMDADGARASAVQKLTFTTVDGTPPEFQYNTPEVTDIGATNLRLRINLNENGTFYWVAVRAGADYLNAPTTAAKTAGGQIEQSPENRVLFEEYFRRQIENGINGVRNGSQAVRANTDTTVNITGLTAETSYDVYYIAKDTAGNYSLLSVTWDEANHTYVLVNDAESKNMFTESTLDTSGPTATQEFTQYDTSLRQPYANTDIIITLDENVQQTSKIRTNGADLVSLYKAVESAAGKATAAEGDAEAAKELADAKKALGDFLSATLRLYTTSATGRAALAEVRGAGNDSSWVIDYREATVEQNVSTGAVAVTFKTDAGALNLRSGATYYFQLTDLSDVSANRNPLTGGSLTLPTFITISSQISLSEANVTKVNDDDIDAAFTMIPVSTKTAATDQLWDMVIWADTSCDFKLYYREQTAEGEWNDDWKPTKNTGSIIKTIYDKGTYMGVSLQRSLLGLESNPSVTSLDRPAYQYAIHIEKLDGNAERETWSQTVTFWVTVDVGKTNNDMRLLSSYVIGGSSLYETPEQAYAALQAEQTVTEISTPENFTIRVPFTDEKAPNFAGAFPAFTPGDTYVTMELLLNREGTVYYVIAPAGNSAKGTGNTIITRRSGADVFYDDDAVPTGGSAPLELDENAPAPNNIYNPRYNNADIKRGSASAGTGSVSVSVTDLKPETEYFAYFVLKGTGAVYSEKVLLYKFTTREVVRPIITLDLQNPNVFISSDTNAVADWMLVVYNNRLLSSLLTAKFSTVCIETTPDAYKKDDYTVLRAMNANGSDGGSVFDEYATEDEKSVIAAYIQAATASSSGSVVAVGHNLNVAAGRRISVSCAEYMSPTTQYAFLTTGRSALGSGYAFRAIYPVFKPDSMHPVVTTLSAALTVNTSGPTVSSYTVSGSITLSFDEYLYYLERSDNPETADTLYSVDTAPILGDSASGYVHLGNLVTARSNSNAISVSDTGKAGVQTQTITATVTNATNGTYMTFTSYLCDQYSNMGTESLAITVRIVKDEDDNYIAVAEIPASWDGR